MDTLEKWLSDTENPMIQTWDKLPDIDLYMDQVITYMERQLSVIKVSDDEKIITPSMINNYSKDGIIPRAVAKKYSKEHLSALLIVCMLKQVLPINYIKTMLSEVRENNTLENAYSCFILAQESALKEAAENVSRELESIGDDKIKLNMLAMQLAAQANALRIASEKIIASNNVSEKESKK